MKKAIIMGLGIVLIVVIVIIVQGKTTNKNDNSVEESIEEVSILTEDSNVTVKSKTLEETIDDEDTELFQLIMEDSNSEIPYIHIGEVVEIKFNNKIPETYELKDCLLRENGKILYDSRLIETINVEKKDDDYYFILDMNYAVILSSDSRSYEPGQTLRGLKLICDYGDEKKEYAFIIRTDADE